MSATRRSTSPWLIASMNPMTAATGGSGVRTRRSSQMPGSEVDERSAGDVGEDRGHRTGPVRGEQDGGVRHFGQQGKPSHQGAAALGGLVFGLRKAGRGGMQPGD